MVSCGLTVFFCCCRFSLAVVTCVFWFLFAAVVWVETPRSNHNSHTNNRGHLLFCHGHWLLGAAKRRSTHTPHTTSQAEPHRSEANRTTPSRVEPSRAEPSQARTVPHDTTPHHVTPRQKQSRPNQARSLGVVLCLRDPGDCPVVA